MEKTYRPKPLEYFHAKVTELFHEYRKQQGNDTTVPINGIVFNNLVADAKKLTYEEYPELAELPK